jgi:orotidine-5'-phosphate decarboxylase
VPAVETFALVTTALTRSYVKRSSSPFVSPGIRFDARDQNAITRPSPLIAAM